MSRHNDRLFPRGFYGRFIITMALRLVNQEVCKTHVCAKFFEFHYTWIYGAAIFLASDNIINWSKARRTARIVTLIILQRPDSMKIMHNFNTEQIRNSVIWLVESRNCVNWFANRRKISHYSTLGDREMYTLFGLFLFTFLFIFDPSRVTI